MNVTGARCECTDCGEPFNRVSTFDKHRTGSFAKPGEWAGTRGCMTPGQMAAKGWRKNDAGWWVTGGGFWKPQP